MTAYHQVRASALSSAGSFLVCATGSLLIPMAKAVRTASPTYMYDTDKVGEFVIRDSHSRGCRAFGCTHSEGSVHFDKLWPRTRRISFRGRSKQTLEAVHYHEEVALNHVEVCDHTELVTPGTGFVKEFSTPLYIPKTVDGFVAPDSNKGTKRQEAVV